MWRSLGKVIVTTAGTPVRATLNETVPTERYGAHAMLFQQVPGNTGKLYIMDRQTGNASTGAGVLAVLAIPTVNLLPSASATITYAAAGFNAADFWIDAEVSGQGCQVSAIQA